MRTRSEELRARNRRVFAVSYVVAALVLAAVFVLSPEFHVEPIESTEIERQNPESESVPTAPLFVQVLFGPPEILDTDGTWSRESPDRVLEVGRVVELPVECREALLAESIPASGQVRLRVMGSGGADLVEVTRSGGTPCVDRLIAIVAGALQYEWLPDDRFPPPVDLLQPVRVLDVGVPL